MMYSAVEAFTEAAARTQNSQPAQRVVVQGYAMTPLALSGLGTIQRRWYSDPCATGCAAGGWQASSVASEELLARHINATTGSYGSLIHACSGDMASACFPAARTLFFCALVDYLVTTAWHESGNRTHKTGI